MREEEAVGGHAKTLRELIEPLMLEREGEYTHEEIITVFCGTWNVNGRNPPASLDQWLCANADPPAIVAVGFQEMDLTGQALLLGDTSKAGPWERLITRSINSYEGADYSLIASRQLVGMFLCLYVQEQYKSKISDVRTGSAGCGIMGKMGNKGAVGVRFNFLDTTLCFVNSHLSAHKDNVVRRNQDYNEICKRLRFEDPHPLSSQEPFSILEHDGVFWIGDLNYRLDRDGKKVRSAIENGRHHELLIHDQLFQQRGQGKCFQEFHEAPINFLPTYKYDTGSDTYDTSEKMRDPAWCDRVLWTGRAISTFINYDRHEILSSDHRPVSALLEVVVKSVLPEEKQVVMRDVIRQLDMKENSLIAHCTLSTHRIDFGDVRIDTPQKQSLNLTNESSLSSKSLLKWRLLPKPNTSRACPSWLQVEPSRGILVPTESIEISFTLRISAAMALPFNANEDTLADIVIIHLENGTDYYVEVRGNFLRTCIGNTLENLVRHPKPLRINQPLSAECRLSLSIPKELRLLLDYLYRFTLDQPKLFVDTGSEEEIQEVIECLDTGRSLSEYKGSKLSVGGCLLYFLKSLHEPVVPFSIGLKCMEDSDSVEICSKYLLGISTVHYSAFHYVVAFLRDEVLSHSSGNGLTAGTLATIFAPALLHTSLERTNEDYLRMSTVFVRNFLVGRDE